MKFQNTLLAGVIGSCLIATQHACASFISQGVTSDIIKAHFRETKHHRRQHSTFDQVEGDHGLSFTEQDGVGNVEVSSCSQPCPQDSQGGSTTCKSFHYTADGSTSTLRYFCVPNDGRPYCGYPASSQYRGWGWCPSGFVCKDHLGIEMQCNDNTPQCMYGYTKYTLNDCYGSWQSCTPPQFGCSNVEGFQNYGNQKCQYQNACPTPSPTPAPTIIPTTAKPTVLTLPPITIIPTSNKPDVTTTAASTVVPTSSASTTSPASTSQSPTTSSTTSAPSTSSTKALNAVSHALQTSQQWSFIAVSVVTIVFMATF